MSAQHTLERSKAPRRKVIGTIIGLQSFTCELSCGHFGHTGRWATSYGTTRPAPKTMSCIKCAKAAGSTT